jgi:hypothetical protein
MDRVNGTMYRIAAACGLPDYLPGKLIKWDVCE